MATEIQTQAKLPLLKRFAKALQDMAALAIGSIEEQNARATKVAPVLKLAQSGVFKMVVMGEVKKGKSSFINALLGIGNKLPTDSDIATSIVYKLVYGPKERVTVFFQEDENGSSRAPLEIGIEQISDYGTEKGNPNNTQNVEFIALELPCEFLKGGNAIVDTPGVGGLFKKHRYISYQYAPNADVVLFIVDSVESKMTRDEVSFLEELTKNTPHIVFIQTKADLADYEQVEHWKDRNLEIISEALGAKSETIPYFVVSSKLKRLANERGSVEDLEDSGFLEFQNFLNECLLPAREAILVRRLMPGIHDILEEERVLLTDRLSVTRQAVEGQKPELEKKKQQLEGVKTEFSHWKKNEWPKLLRSFKNSVADMERQARNLLDDITYPDHSVPQAISSVRTNCDNAQRVEQISEMMLAEHASQINDSINNLLRNFSSEFQAVCHNTIGESGNQIRRFTEQLSLVQPSEIKKTNMGGDLGAARDAFFGGMFLPNVGSFGSQIANKFGLAKLPILIASAPVIKLGLVAASIWAAVKFFVNNKERQLGAAVQNLESALTKTCHAARRAGTRHLSDLSAELKRNAEDALEDHQMSVAQSFEVRIEEIANAIQRSGEENSRQMEQYQMESQQFGKVFRTFEQIWKEVSEQ